MRKLAIAVLAWCFVACLAAAGEPQAASPNCQLKRFATLPISISESGLITVPIKVEGQPLNMLIDTGGFSTILTKAAATRLHLKKQPIATRDRLFGFGGWQSAYGATANLEVAGIPISGKAFNLMSGLEPDVDGILGTDILSAFDVDVDYAGSKLNLFSPDHCPGKVVYWTHDAPAVVPFDWSERKRQIHLDVNLDGHSFPAAIDTGASTSVLIYDEARPYFDIDESVLRKNRRFPFKKLSFEGGVTVANPDILLFRSFEASVLGNGAAPYMLVGADILRQLHIYFAFKEEKFYATAVPSTAVAYTQLSQGIGSAKRGDFKSAISLYSQALESGTLVADQRRRVLLNRGGIEYDTDDCTKALSDVETALQIQPDSEEAHIDRAEVRACLGDKAAIGDVDFVIARDASWLNYDLRGRLDWAAGEFATAAADFDKAYKLQPGDSYRLVWYAIAAARTGTIDLATLTKEVHAFRRNWGWNWPTPILYVFTGEDGDESDLKSTIKSGEDVNVHQCEADFFIGEWRLAHKQADMAKPLLQKAADECEVRSIGRRYAKAELARMP